MNHPEKQLKYSIRKVSVGAASIVIGAFYLAMGAGVVHAETNATTEGGISHSSPSPGSNTNNPNSLPGSNYQAKPAPNPATLLAGVAHSVKEETETKTVTRTIKYVDASDESKEVSASVTQTVTLTRKKGTEEWTTGKWEVKTAPTVDGYDVSGNNTVEAKEVTSSTKDETVLVYYSKKESASSNSSSTSETTTTRSRRVRREVGDNTDGGTDETSTGTTVNKKETVVDPKRKGETVQENHPGVNVPKKGEEGADDPNAHLTFKKPGDDATVEEMWKIIQNMPDDFQNNERSYLRNMDTLGDNLRFDENGNVTDNPNGKKLQPGEIREISSFGGWTAIMKKDGTTGKFAVGMKNKEGYFTGWYTKDGKREEGGMLGSDALDRIYLHEQALDRRFKYMLMLAKGRTIANKDDVAQDGTKFDIKTANNTNNKEALNKLPVKEKEDKLQHSPNIEGFNGMEKTFKAFSTEYGSRLKIDFVTGYISDYEGSKGTYRIVVKAIKKDNSEETIYDHTINRIDGVVENEERYSQGVDLKSFNKLIKNLLKLEYDKKVNPLAHAKYREKYPTDKKIDKDKLNALKEEVKQDLAKNGDTIVELPVDKEKLQEGTGKLKNKFKAELNFTENYATVANKLRNELNSTIKDTEVKKDSPIWTVSNELNSEGIQKQKDPDRVYKLLNFVLPTAKKIVYHGDTDQLELQTDPEKVSKHRKELEDRLKMKKDSLASSTNEDEKTKLKKEISALESAIRSTNTYTYMEARNGSKEAKILGSKMEASEKPPTTEMTEDEYKRIHTNALADKAEHGLERFTAYFVEKEKIRRSDVLPDAELSKKITEEIGGDEDKLGKGGYFSTGDIPLAKDVVAYKIQVFAENEKRVGVNKQSPRLQYNLPILADFSVIQDTVEASKEVARRIVKKLKEKGKITEEREKKIKEEIEKAKKTSDLRSSLSANVKVKYVDKNGNPLNIKDDSKFGKKDSDNTYLVKKDVLLTNEYDVSSSKRTIIEGANDKYYKLVSANDGLLANSAPVKGTIETVDDKVVTFVYEETEKPAAPTTGKGLVRFKKQVTETKTEALKGYDDITLTGNVGEKFSSNDVDTKITELKRRGYDIVTNEFETKSKKIDSQTDADGQEPSQVYNVVVKERITTDTETKKVTRTIKYVKIDDSTGKEVEVENVQPTNTKTVEFTRNLTINLVTGLTTNGPWSEKQTFEEVKTPVLTGYIADKAKVESSEVTADSADIVEKIVYRKIGSWVPKVPDGVKPPTGTDITPIPYPNDPDDPTKPKNPEYPETPGGNETPGTPSDPNKPTPPVIPYVPGYTPKIGGNPLEPVDPKHPENGYKVPPVPTPPNDPKTNTQIEYAADSQKAVIKFVVVGEDGKETELETSRITVTGKTGEKIPTENFNDTLKKLTGDPVNNGDYELVENPLKDGATFDKVKDEEGKDPSQIFTVKLRQIYVIPPTPRIVERPSGNTVEVDVPNKDADTLSITFTKRNSTEKETIVTKKDKDGTWKIEKSPVGVTINPTNGRVYIPSEQVQPKTWVDTQTKHKYKQSKIVSVMPNILDVPKFEGTTEWIDVNGIVLRPTEDGLHEKGRIANHVWLESRLEGNKVTHIFFAGSPSVDKPEQEYKITVWFDKDGTRLKPDQPGTHEAGNIPGYRYITTVTKDGITIYRFEKIPPVLPNEPIPDRPEEPRPQPNPEHPSAPTPSPELPNQPEPTPEPETPVSPKPEVPTSETNRREELPNTGTEANATLASAGIMTLLAGLGLGFFKKKEEDEK